MTEIHKQVTQHPRQRCYFCGSEGPIETHHIVPRRHDGDDHESNLVDVCANCHQRLEALYDQRFFDKIADAATVEANVQYTLRSMKRFVCDNYELEYNTREELVYTIAEFYKTDYTLQEAKLIVDDLIERELIAQNGDAVALLIDCEKYGTDTSDVVETGESEQATTKTQRDRQENVKWLISKIEEDFGKGAPVEEVLDRAGEIDMQPSKVEEEIENLRRKGEAYEPKQDHLRTT